MREALLAADCVVPSLDAVTEAVFRSLNRPHPSLDLSLILEGLKAFRKDYRGQFHLEIMLVSGFNNHPDELKKMRPLIDLLHPDQVELNTVVRPPADPCCQGLSSDKMEAVRKFFPAGSTEIIGYFKGFRGLERDLNTDQRIMDMVQRRPCTVDEMAASLGVLPGDLQRTIQICSQENKSPGMFSAVLNMFAGRTEKPGIDTSSILKPSAGGVPLSSVAKPLKRGA